MFADVHIDLYVHIDLKFGTKVCAEKLNRNLLTYTGSCNVGVEDTMEKREALIQRAFNI